MCFANPGTSEMHFVAALDRVEGIRCVLGLFARHRTDFHRTADHEKWTTARNLGCLVKILSGDNRVAADQILCFGIGALRISERGPASVLPPCANGAQLEILPALVSEMIQS